MDSLLATLLPLAQAVEPAPRPLDIAVGIVKSLMPAENLAVALLAIAIGVVIQIVAYWIAAKVVVGDPMGSIGNAFKLWLLYLLIGIGFIMVLAIVIPMLVIANDATAAYAVLAGASILALALIFLVPIKVFEIGLGRAITFLVLSVVLMLATQAAILRAQGKPAFGQLPAAVETLRAGDKRYQWFEQVAGMRRSTELDDELTRLALPEERAKPFPERQENLRKVYTALDARQKTLPAGDAKALKDYDGLRAKYEELVRVLKADYAASKGQPSTP